MTAKEMVAAAPAIVEAGSFDLPVLAALHAQSFADGMAGAVWSEAAIARVLGLPGAFGVLARSGQSVRDPVPLGFALGRHAADEAEILSLGVSPQARRRGVGRALVGAVLARAALGGARRLYLEVAEDNLAAHRLYGGVGFTLVGRRPAYYRRPSGAVAALVFARPVGPGPGRARA